MDDELQKLRKQVEELTELFHLQSQRAMDYAGMAMRKREWKELTDEEVEKIYLGSFDEGQFARAIEAKLKEKNAPASPS